MKNTWQTDGKDLLIYVTECSEGVNAWYQIIGYGFKYGLWFGIESEIRRVRGMNEADGEAVLRAMAVEAEGRGLVPGALIDFKPINNHWSDPVEISKDAVYSFNSNDFAIGNYYICMDGVWAEVVEDSMLNVKYSSEKTITELKFDSDKKIKQYFEWNEHSIGSRDSFRKQLIYVGWDIIGEVKSTDGSNGMVFFCEMSSKKSLDDVLKKLENIGGGESDYIARMIEETATEKLDKDIDSGFPFSDDPKYKPPISFTKENLLNKKLPETKHSSDDSRTQIIELINKLIDKL